MTTPTPGSKRAIRMMQVQNSLLKDGRATYADLAKRIGLSVAAVCKACDDLRYENDDSLVLAIPAPANGYTVSMEWSLEAAQGETNQIKHLITRLERMAKRYDNIAGGLSGAERMVFRQAERSLRTVAEEGRDVLEFLAEMESALAPLAP